MTGTSTAIPIAGPFVQKQIYDSVAMTTLLDTLTSAGAPDSSVALSNKFLYVVDTITIPSGTAIGSIAQTYKQEVNEEPPGVPEPATYFLIGTGLLGLAFLRRRRTG